MIEARYRGSLKTSVVGHMVDEILCGLCLAGEELLLLDRQRSVRFYQVLRFEIFVKIVVQRPVVVLFGLGLTFLAIVELPRVE